jgi:OOP family OmpA-OmpF porin
MKPHLPIRTAVALLAAATLAGAAHGADAAVEKVTVRAVARFGFDSVALNAEDQARLLAEVGEMKDVSWQTVVATGHTDSIGNPVYNEALAARRAAAVKDYLLGKGLPPALVRTAARGPAQPVADNTSAEGRARNRRAEVVFEGVRPVAR